MSMIKEYEEALERLKSNNTIRLPKNSKINNDTVALEAGRKRGSIKRSRAIFNDLIKDIDEIINREKLPKQTYEKKIMKWKTQAIEYRELYQDALNRELMLIEKVSNLETKLKKDLSNKLLVANNV